MRDVIERAQKTAKNIDYVFSTIGILTIIGGIILGVLSSMVDGVFHLLILIAYVIGSVLAGLLLIYLGRSICSILECLCVIAHNSGHNKIREVRNYAEADM